MKRLSLIALCFFLFSFTTENYGSVRVTSSITSSSDLVDLVYKNGRLSIKGLTGVGTIRIYSIIGNQVAVFNQVKLRDFQQNILLDRKTMYIIRVESMGKIKTYKLVTR